MPSESSVNDQSSDITSESAVETPPESSTSLRPEDFQVDADEHSTMVDRRIEITELPELSFDYMEQGQIFKDASGGDGVLERSEIERQLAEGNLSDRERDVLKEMRAGYDYLSGLSTGEEGDSRGITAEDMVEHLNRGSDASGDLQLIAETARLTDAVESRLSPEQRETFKQNMEAFEKRMEGNPEEIARTYQQLERILNPKADTVVPESKLGSLAMDAIAQAADPESVKQGIRHTCSVASLESRIYERHPASAVGLLADVATTGRYTRADGSTMTVDEESAAFYPDYWRELAKQGHDTRSHASQIFQITAANMHAESLNPRWQYVMRLQEGGRIDEYLVDNQSGERLSEAPGVSIFNADNLNDLNTQITGYEEPPFVVDVTRARTPEELREQLDTLERQGNLPGILVVNGANPPFEGALGAGSPYHVVAVRPGSSPDTVFVNDQYGEEKDQEVSLEQLHRSMKLPEGIERIPGFAEQAARTFEQLDKVGISRIPEELKDKMMMLMHEYTPGQLDVIAEKYEELTGKELGDLFGQHISEEDMGLLGFEKGWFSGSWVRKDS